MVRTADPTGLFRFSALSFYRSILSVLLFASLPARADDSVLALEQHRIDVIARIAPAVVSVLDQDRVGGGSGVIVDPQGYGLTNFHVVAGLLETRRGLGGLTGGKTYDLHVLGIDPTGDIAMFKLDGKEPFACVELGDSDAVRVGDWAMAMGNPFLFAEDYSPTVTLGIVSGMHRYQEGAGGTQLVYTDCIQVDSSINPGNSGGPLFDAAGRLIGINGRGAFEERGRINVGLGFAVSVNQIKRFIPALRAGLFVEHGSLGATVTDVGYRHVVFERMFEDSVAAKAGLKVGHRLRRFAGREIHTANQFANVLGTLPASWPVDVAYADEFGEHAVRVRLERLPARTPEPYKTDEQVNRRAVRYVLDRYHARPPTPGGDSRRSELAALVDPVLATPWKDEHAKRWSHVGADAVYEGALSTACRIAEVLDYTDGDTKLRFWFDAVTFELLHAANRDDATNAIVQSAGSTRADAVVNPATSAPFTDIIAAVAPSIVKLYGVGIALEHGYGSGVIITEDGYVVTTLSLLLETENLRAVTADGHLYRAEVKYRDPNRQLAMLKLRPRPEDTDTDLPARRQAEVTTFRPLRTAISSRSLQPGDWVLALGNPFRVADGEEPVSVLKGVFTLRTKLDARHRAQDFPYRGEVLVVDAITSNPGSPGGVLIDLDGRWVGLTGKVVRSTLTNTRLNYALPIEEVIAFADEARSGTPPPSATQPAELGPKGYHGIRLFSLAYRNRLPFVERVDLGSPADRAGVRKEDLILSANGVSVSNAAAFERVCERLTAGEELTLVVKRGSQLLPVTFKLEAPPP